MTATPTPGPTPGPSPASVPLGNIIKDTYNTLIRAPFSSLFQEPATSYQYDDRVLSNRTSASLFLISAVLIIASLLFLKYMKNSIGKYWYFFFFLGIIILAGVLYVNNSLHNRTRSFSSYTLLSSSWEKYKERFIQKSGQVVDGDSITTSEGQSYALLQSVIADDKKTFDTVWNWTNRHLKRSSDALFGWRYGTLPDKKTAGLLPNGGDNSASDADTDIALSLILASRRWHTPSYKNSALTVLAGMWKTEVATASGTLYLTAGNWAKSPNELVVNPSYFAPYAWRIFAQEDKTHDWKSLIAPAYELLADASQSSLDTGATSGLIPDWISIKTDTGEIKATSIPNLTTAYSFDAMRVPWRIAVDYQQNKDTRAIDYLKTQGFLVSQYKANGRLAQAYSHDGKVINSAESPVMYATALGVFMYKDPELARKIYQDKILNLYSTDANAFKQNLSYYDENWLWFGTALYLNAFYKF